MGGLLKFFERIPFSIHFTFLEVSMSHLAPLVASWPWFFARSAFSPSHSALSLVCLSQAKATEAAQFARSFGMPVVVVARCGCSRLGSLWIVGCGFSLSSVLAWCRRRNQCGSLFQVWSSSFTGIIGFHVGSWRGFGFWSPGVRYSVTTGFSIRRGWQPLRRGPSALRWAGWLASGCIGGAPSLPRPLARLRGAMLPISPSLPAAGVGARVGGSPSTLARLLAALPPHLRPASVLWRPSRRIRAAVAACFFSSFAAASSLARQFPGSALRRSPSGWSVSVPFRSWPGGFALAHLLSVALNRATDTTEITTVPSLIY